MNNEQKQSHTASPQESIFKKPWMKSIIYMLVIFSILGGFIYWAINHNLVYIENSYLDAPTIVIAPGTSGTLNALYVQEGARVEANSPVAVVGSETLFAKEGGIVSFAPQAVGGFYTPGQKVVSEIADRKMRVVGQLEETKGLDRVAVGQYVTFTVDTFGSKKYEGQVSEVSPVSVDTGVVFSISDKRPIKKFNVYVAFDTLKYPELRSGMSAKMDVHVK